MIPYLSQPTNRYVPSFLQLVGWTFSGTVGLGFVWLFARRVTGSYTPLPAPMLIGLTMILVLAYEFLRWMFRLNDSIEPGSTTRARRCWRASLMLAPLAGAILLLATAAGSWRGLLAICLTVLPYVGWIATDTGARWRRRPASRNRDHTPPHAPRPKPDLGERQVTQQIRRDVGWDGTESIRAFLKTRTNRGERHYDFHVAFCPPLLGALQSSVMVASDLSATAKVAELRSYGARIEVKLHEALEEPVELAIDFRSHSVPRAKRIPSPQISQR